MIIRSEKDLFDELRMIDSIVKSRAEIEAVAPTREMAEHQVTASLGRMAREAYARRVKAVAKQIVARVETKYAYKAPELWLDGAIGEAWSILTEELGYEITSESLEKEVRDYFMTVF